MCGDPVGVGGVRAGRKLVRNGCCTPIKSKPNVP
jgi:hypothetical protein